MLSGRVRGRGQGRKKRAKTEALPVGAVDAGEGLATVHQCTSRSTGMVKLAPLGVLMRIEATIWMNARGAGHISIDDFYELIQSHGWLGLKKNADSNGADETKIVVTTPKIVSKLSNDVYELISKLTEEERLLFDFMAVSAWEPKEIPNLYPLYRLHSLPKGIQLEILQQPHLKETKSATATAKPNTKITTRSEVLGNMYHHSRKHFSFSSKLGNPRALQNWWLHAQGVAKIILDNRESTTASTSNMGSSAENTSLRSLMKNDTDAVTFKSETKQNGEKKTTLEERVRARSLRSQQIENSKQASKTGGGSSQENKNKALLELADALRSYSQRRGLVSSGGGGGGGSALDRLRNRGSGCTHSTKSIARLTMTDLLKDARTTWKSIVNESIHQPDGSGGTKSRVGGAMSVVNIDLSRVLFQLRLKMLSEANVSDRRQMELQLIALLEELMTLVPKWMSLRKVPSTLSDQNATTSNQRLNIRQSIIIIRNDSVNYAMDVRAKLGGRVHNPADLAAQSNSGGRKTGVPKCNKRSLQEMMDQQQPQNKVHGHVGVADVPPSFLRIYGKALGLDEESKN